MQLWKGLTRMTGDQEYITGVIDDLLYLARIEGTTSATGSLDMAIMYLRHYLRLMSSDEKSQKAI